jgi:hypothetical protein
VDEAGEATRYRPHLGGWEEQESGDPYMRPAIDQSLVQA